MHNTFFLITREKESEFVNIYIYPPGNKKKISHPKGSSENHRLKSASWPLWSMAATPSVNPMASPKTSPREGPKANQFVVTKQRKPAKRGDFPLIILVSNHFDNSILNSQECDIWDNMGLSVWDNELM